MISQNDIMAKKRKNKMKKIIVSMGCLLMLAGCAGPQNWIKPGVTQEEANQDLRECDYESEKYAFVPIYGTGAAAGIEQALRKHDLMAKCLSMKGYRPEGR